MCFKQRNYPRVEINTPIAITVDNQTLQNAECVNISMGGMCINVLEYVKEQQKGTVEMPYESEDGTVIFKGEFTIRWAKPLAGDTTNKKQIGIQFTYYDYQNLTNLARIIVSQLSKCGEGNTV